MPVANQSPASVAHEYATIQFIVQQLLNGAATAALVRVQKCTNAGELAPVGKADLQLLTDQITGDGQALPHGTVFNAPYMRMQGGANAVILDPQAGDLGVCVFAMRDITPIKKDPVAALSRAPVPGAPPGSKRTYSLSDALYIGGMLNGVPTQYVRFSSEGIELVSPTKVTLQAPEIDLKGTVAQTGGNVTMANDLDVTGTITGQVDVIAGTISGKTHVHSDPQGGDVGPPI
jgi:hypothetical protein